jgi:AcrR family transcriptional regulator
MFKVAAELFRAKGYAATTTREIAKATKLQKGSLYHHIATKEDLLFRICSDAAVRLKASVGDAIEAAPEDERLVAMMSAHLRAALDDRDMHAVTLIELRALSDERRGMVVERRSEYMQMLVDLIGEEQNAGRIRSDIAAKVLALALLDLLNWVIFWYQPGGSLDPDALSTLLSEIYLHGASADGQRSRPPLNLAADAEMAANVGTGEIS